MNRPKKPSLEDIELFRQSIGPVRRLDSDTVQPPARSRAPRPRARPLPAVQPPPTGFAGEPAHAVAADEALLYARTGVQQRQLQRLRRGRLRVEADLDLHGMSIPVAEQEVLRFLATCRRQQLRCVRIIHGKGYGSRESAPVLKNRVNHWLRQHHDVLAFASAPRDRGGTGALHVLLRSQRR